MKGFSDERRFLINNFVFLEEVLPLKSMKILVDTSIQKGLRQGAPLSLMLFNIVADMMAIIIERAKVDAQIEGLVPHLVDGGLSILQYADDTILFMEHDLEKA
jgi:hypothetical protein